MSHGEEVLCTWSIRFGNYQHAIVLFSFYLAKYDADGNENRKVTMHPAGNFRYPFRFELPRFSPTSFEGRHGRVRYWIRATIDRPVRFNLESEKIFTVISHLNLNNLADMMVSNVLSASYTIIFMYMMLNNLLGVISDFHTSNIFTCCHSQAKYKTTETCRIYECVQSIHLLINLAALFDHWAHLSTENLWDFSIFRQISMHRVSKATV